MHSRFALRYAHLSVLSVYALLATGRGFVQQLLWVAALLLVRQAGSLLGSVTQ